MADNNAPFSVRMEQDDKEKLLQLIQESGKSNKEFMSVLLSAYELNKAKIEMPEIAKDIEGLQAVTQRINDYYVNIGKRIEDMQKSKDIEFTKELEIYKSRIETLKDENEKITSEFETVQQSYNNVSANYDDINKQLTQLHESLNDKTLLVEEYKEKNDTITGLLKQYEKYPEQLEATKELLAKTQARELNIKNDLDIKSRENEKLNSDIEALKQDKETAINEIKSKYEATINDLNNRHSTELEAAKEKAELLKDKAILELQKESQQQIQELQQKHNAEIEQYQAKYKELLDQLEKVKAPTHKNTTGAAKTHTKEK
jgi:Chromosome segregation ATPases